MKCEKCQNNMIECKSGEEVSYICPFCDGAPATQSLDLIEYDSNMYSIRVLPVKQYGTSLLKGVSRVCSCNVLTAKKILEESGYAFACRDAIETRALKESLEEIGASFEICPNFRW